MKGETSKGTYHWNEQLTACFSNLAKSYIIIGQLMIVGNYFLKKICNVSEETLKTLKIMVFHFSLGIFVLDMYVNSNNPDA